MLNLLTNMCDETILPIYIENYFEDLFDFIVNGRSQFFESNFSVAHLNFY